MSSVLDTKLPEKASAWLEWLPVLAGLLALYVPTFYAAGTTFWQDDEHAHAPIITRRQTIACQSPASLCSYSDCCCM